MNYAIVVAILATALMLVISYAIIQIVDEEKKKGKR